MTRDEVIRAFEWCRNNSTCDSCDSCKYGGRSFMTCERLADDILSLLKEQEAAEPKITTFPKKDHDDSHIYRCGNCDMIIFKSHKYCPFCGQAVKWNE